MTGRWSHESAIHQNGSLHYDAGLSIGACRDYFSGAVMLCLTRVAVGAAVVSDCESCIVLG